MAAFCQGGTRKVAKNVEKILFVSPEHRVGESTTKEIPEHTNEFPIRIGRGDHRRYENRSGLTLVKSATNEKNMSENNNHHIRLVVLQGSVRPGNNTAKALALLVDEVVNNARVFIEVINPTSMHLPLPGQGASEDAKRMRDTVAAADGIIFATPEYHGSFSSVTKLIIDNLGFPSVLSGKPIALLGVAAGRIGAIKALEHLRSVASHVGGIVLPGPVSVAQVNTIFDDEGNCLDEGIEKMIRGVATGLIHYIENHICPRIALEAMVRSAGVA